MSVNLRDRFVQIRRLRSLGLSSPQIATRLGLTPETVRWTLWKESKRIAQGEKLALDASKPTP